MKPLWVSLSLFAAFATAVQITVTDIRKTREKAISILAPKLPEKTIKVPKNHEFKPIRTAPRASSAPAQTPVAPTPPPAVIAGQDWRLVGISRGAEKGMALFVIGDSKRHVKPGTEIAEGVKVLEVSQNLVKMNIHGEIVEVAPW